MMIRDVTVGSTWQHYKGNIYEVLAIASPGRISATPDKVGIFNVADGTTGQATLFECLATGTNSYFVHRGEADGIQVFYRGENGSQWCRSLSNFLGLVRSDEPRFRLLKSQSRC
jgi:hypothetical protein